jgi:cellulose synthase operon protein C
MQVQRPEQAMGYVSEGVVHMRLKAPDAAVEAYRAGLKQVPNNSELATRLHRTLTTTGRKAEADRFATDWSKARSDDMVFEYHRAITALAAGDLVQAEMRLRTVVERQPDNGWALNNLAWTVATLGKKGSVAYAEKASTLLPNRPAVMDTLATALVQEGNLPRALELQKKVVALVPDDMGMRLNLARIALTAGDKALARTELERIAKEGNRFAYQDRVAVLMKKL